MRWKLSKFIISIINEMKASISYLYFAGIISALVCSCSSKNQKTPVQLGELNMEVSGSDAAKPVFKKGLGVKR
jgi:hypothetical protein